MATAVYRAIQESLTNIARHAGARRAWVMLSVQSGGLEVEVEDFYVLAGYMVPEGLPELAPYLRVKYDLSEDASEQVKRYVARLKKRGQQTDDAKRSPERKP